MAVLSKPTGEEEDELLQGPEPLIDERWLRRTFHQFGIRTFYVPESSVWTLSMVDSELSMLIREPPCRLYIKLLYEWESLPPPPPPPPTHGPVNIGGEDGQPRSGLVFNYTAGDPNPAATPSKYGMYWVDVLSPYGGALLFRFVFESEPDALKMGFEVGMLANMMTSSLQFRDRSETYTDVSRRFAGMWTFTKPETNPTGQPASSIVYGAIMLTPDRNFNILRARGTLSEQLGAEPEETIGDPVTGHFRVLRYHDGDVHFIYTTSSGVTEVIHVEILEGGECRFDGVVWKRAFGMDGDDDVSAADEFLRPEMDDLDEVKVEDFDNPQPSLNRFYQQIGDAEEGGIEEKPEEHPGGENAKDEGGHHGDKKTKERKQRKNRKKAKKKHK